MSDQHSHSPADDNSDYYDDVEVEADEYSEISDDVDILSADGESFEDDEEYYEDEEDHAFSPSPISKITSTNHPSLYAYLRTSEQSSKSHTAGRSRLNSSEIRAGVAASFIPGTSRPRSSVIENTRYEPDLANLGRGKRIAAFDDRPYCGQFSEDGRVFYSANKDFRISLFDVFGGWKRVDIMAHRGNWTITDCDLSQPQTSVKTLAYSSIHDTIHLVDVTRFWGGSDREGFGSAVGDQTRQSHNAMSLNGDFGIWSIRMSAGGSELVAGCSSGYLVVCDLETRTVLHKVHGHTDDVNAVCFIDESSNILVSGSDDTSLKIWDRRSSLRSGSHNSGELYGHTEGITYVAGQGYNGRTVISNGKDQTLRMWDLRRMGASGNARGGADTRTDFRTGFDYRWQRYPGGRRVHPNDGSVAVFKGHEVLRTLIRCHFSPENTGNRYIYTGSSSGGVYIFDPVTTPTGGPPVAILSQPNQEVADAGFEEVVDMPPDSDEEGLRQWAVRYMRRRRNVAGMGGAERCTRDVAWNPMLPQIVSSSWDCSLNLFE